MGTVQARPPALPAPRALAVSARLPAQAERCVAAIRAAGFVHDPRAPDVVLCYGGDGTLLNAERMFPGVPKLAVRESGVGYHCHAVGLERALEQLQAGFACRVLHRKVLAVAGDQVREGLNDVVIRNALPTEAIRFRITVNEGAPSVELIGGGVVVATSFGATGYFYSITKQTFAAGLGVAFNNVTRDVAPLFLSESARIGIVLTRGTAVLTSDNDRQAVTIRAGEQVLIGRSPHSAQVIKLPPELPAALPRTLSRRPTS